MTTSIPGDQEVDAEIGAAQVRDRLLLLYSPLSPADCLRQAELLLSGQREAGQVLHALDHADVPSIARQQHADVRSKMKGSLLGAMNGVRDLGVRRNYILDMQKNAATFLHELKGCDKDTLKMFEVTKKAVDARNELRDALNARSASAVAKYQRDGMAGLKGFYRHIAGKSSEDKHSIGYLLQASSGKTPFHELPEAEQQKIFTRIVEQSGTAGTLSSILKTVKASRATLQTTIDVLLIVEEARYARDPLRTVASGAVRLGAAVAVSAFTETALFTLVAGLGLSTGVGTLILLGGSYFANQELNAWINSTFLDLYDQFNPRIAAVMRDTSWEPEDFSTDLLGEPLTAALTGDFKTSLL